jgi:hypothetical protein
MYLKKISGSSLTAKTNEHLGKLIQTEKDEKRYLVKLECMVRAFRRVG